jgi:hypothetical protein
MAINNYDISGIGSSVQFGKKGGRVVYNPVNNTFTLTETDISNTAALDASEISAVTGDVTVSDPTKSFNLAGTKLSLDSNTVFKIDSTTAFMIPTGSDSDRPETGKVGMIRVNNNTIPFVEYYTGTGWQSVATAVGSGTVTSVGFSTGSTGLSVTTGPATYDPITTSGTFTLSGTLNSSNGGTGYYSYAAGDMLVGSTTDTLQKLSVGTQGQILAVNNNTPTWVDSGSVSIPFTYGDATPKNLIVVPANAIITEVSIIITTPFNGTAGSLTIGDAVQFNRLMDSSDNTVYVAGTYSVDPGYKYNSSTQLLLFITPGTSSAGSGVILINYK